MLSSFARASLRLSSPLPWYRLFVHDARPPAGTPTAKVTFITRDDKTVHVDAPVTMNILAVANDHDIKIPAACEGMCACDAFKNGSRINPVASGILSKPKTCEDDILDSAFGVQPNSRLACQATLLPPAASADITVKVVVPKSSKNISRSDFKSKKSKTK